MNCLLLGSDPVRTSEHEPGLELQVEHSVEEPSQHDEEANVDAVPVPLFRQREESVVGSLFPPHTVLVVTCVTAQVAETSGEYCKWEEGENYSPTQVDFFTIDLASCHLNDGTDQEDNESE